jgi:S1-C subfamily serine protease
VVAPGLALTNRHVVSGVLVHGRALTLSRGAERVPARLRLVASDLDLAALEPARPLAGTVEPARAMPARGAPLYAAGTVRGVPTTAAGRFLGSDPFEPGMLLARLPARPGFSGGPVLDGEGRLLGLVTAALVDTPTRARELAATRTTGESGLPMVRVLGMAAALPRLAALLR